MSSDWTFGRKLIFGFGFAAFCVLLLSFFGYQSTHRLIENDRWVNHTSQTRRELAELLSYMKDAETGQRGYVITGRDEYLDVHREALAQLDRLYGDLRHLTADNPEQQRRLDTLRTPMDAKLAELKRTLEIRHNQGFEAAQAAVASGVGKGFMDDVRRIVGEMDHSEQVLLEQRHATAETSADVTKGIILWGTLGAVAMIALTGVVIARTLTRQIGAAVQHIQSSSSELQSSANQQATGAREQASAMSEIATTISELLATSRQIAESAQRVAQVAEQTVHAAEIGGTTVERGHEMATGLRRQVDLIVSQMLELGKKSQQIGAVLDIVAELAEQTNILAINATIEAAGAGDAGKRFAVVADEIRKLADRVGGSTKEIRGLIDDVRGAVNTTVMTTETGSKAAEAGARQFLEVATAFKQIVSQVSTTTEASKEIGLSTKQQATAVEQVNIAITNVAQATKESEVSTSQTLRTASELAALSRDLLKIVTAERDRSVRA